MFDLSQPATSISILHQHPVFRNSSDTVLATVDKEGAKVYSLGRAEPTPV
jgi:hypothetical protein